MESAAVKYIRSFRAQKAVKPKWLVDMENKVSSDREVEQMRLKTLELSLKDDHDAFTKSSVLQRQDTGDADVKERQAKGMQGPEHPHGSGDETGAGCSETHAYPSGYEEDSQAFLPATGIVQMS